MENSTQQSRQNAFPCENVDTDSESRLCNICNKPFRNKNMLNDHVKTTHLDISEKALGNNCDEESGINN
jgi:recombinational DNA repair protein RecR